MFSVRNMAIFSLAILINRKKKKKKKRLNSVTRFQIIQLFRKFVSL